MKPCGLLVVISTILRHEDIHVNIRSTIPFSLKSWTVTRRKQLIEQGDDFKSIIPFSANNLKTGVLISKELKSSVSLSG